MKVRRTPMTEEASPSGQCSLINTLNVWFPASWAPMVAERCLAGPPIQESLPHSQHVQPASGPSQKQSGVHPWMIKLFWTAILCYRKESFAMFSRGTRTEEISDQTFRKERRRLQAKHLWMEVKLRWQVLADRMYTKAATGKSREELYALLFDKAARGSQKNPYEEKAYRGSALKAVQTGWEQCQKWMLYFKGHSAPCAMDLHGLLQAFRCKEEAARAEVEAFMEHCAKRWQTKEGTYQLKRRRLLPDVRDPPEQGNADIDMKDI